MARKIIPYGYHSIDAEDIEQVVHVLKEEFITQGSITPEFEKQLANYVAADFAVAFNSATSALHAAYLAVGLKPGEIVWTTPITFVATANAARMCGATVDFIDVNERTGLIDIDLIAEQLRTADKKGILPKLIVPVHYSGQSCDMKNLKELADQFDIKIVEDASHALGADYLNSKVGNCRFSDITVFSFHPVKMITTGEGGMATTNCLSIQERLARLRSHGVTRDGVDLPWQYQQVELGYNYRMPDINAALGLSQLKKLDNFVAQRRALAERYLDSFKSLAIECLPEHLLTTSSWHLFPILVNPDERTRIFNELRQSNIGVNVHYIPVDQQPFYDTGSYCQRADLFYSREISIPLYPELAKSQQDHVINTLSEVVYEFAQ